MPKATRLRDSRIPDATRTTTATVKFNELATALVPNPTAGTEHAFRTYRLAGDPFEPLVLRERSR